MPELEFDPVDAVAAGAVGAPGQRSFFIQASKGGQTISVLVEKEQVAVLSARLTTLLDEVATRFPDAEDDVDDAEVAGDPVPLFRAVAIGIGFDPARQMVLIELHERPVPDEEEEAGPEPVADDPALAALTADEGYLARLYLSLGQARAMARGGSEAVRAGRPPCPMCGGPLDPAGHVCPKLNGHVRR
ncbi:MAG: DUF3090 family protein [Acidimicrobiia bacterium]